MLRYKVLEAFVEEGKVYPMKDAELVNVLAPDMLPQVFLRIVDGVPVAFKGDEESGSVVYADNFVIQYQLVDYAIHNSLEVEHC